MHESEEQNKENLYSAKKSDTLTDLEGKIEASSLESIPDHPIGDQDPMIFLKDNSVGSEAGVSEQLTAPAAWTAARQLVSYFRGPLYGDKQTYGRSKSQIRVNIGSGLISKERPNIEK